MSVRQKEREKAISRDQDKNTEGQTKVQGLLQGSHHFQQLVSNYWRFQGFHCGSIHFQLNFKLYHCYQVFCTGCLKRSPKLLFNQFMGLLKTFQWLKSVLIFSFNKNLGYRLFQFFIQFLSMDFSFNETFILESVNHTLSFWTVLHWRPYWM